MTLEAKANLNNSTVLRCRPKLMRFSSLTEDVFRKLKVAIQIQVLRTPSVRPQTEEFSQEIQQPVVQHIPNPSGLNSSINASLSPEPSRFQDIRIQDIRIQVAQEVEVLEEEDQEVEVIQEEDMEEVTTDRRDTSRDIRQDSRQDRRQDIIRELHPMDQARPDSISRIRFPRQDHQMMGNGGCRHRPGPQGPALECRSRAGSGR